MRALGLALASTLAIATTGAAQNVDASDPERIASILQQMGYRAALLSDVYGDPMIATSAAGGDIQIYFYECMENRDCKAIQFSAGFDLEAPIPASKINEWNREYRYGQAFVDEEGDPFVHYTLNLRGGGVSVGNLENSVKIYETVLNDFKAFIDW